MKKYTTLLFDADGTILDFDRAEENALEAVFVKFALSYDARALSVYRKNNNAAWQLFEEGKLTKSEVLLVRFKNTFLELNVGADFIEVAAVFQKLLGEGYFILGDAEEVLEKLYGKRDLYLVSNGVLETQNSRMAGSGLGRFFTESFISERIGYNKPQKEYFDYCFSNIKNFDIEKTLIIGDSLSSDIAGGINAGIDTCWFNPQKKQSKLLKPTFEIDDLNELFDIV